MYKTVLFDLDGTLIDSAPGIIACMRIALQEMGWPEQAPETYRRMVGPPVIQGLMTFFGMTRPEAEQTHKIYRSHYEAVALTNLSVFTGIPELLRTLKGAGVVLGVATSKPEIYARRILEDYEIADCFAVIAGSTLDGSRSTKEDVLRYAMTCLRDLHADTENIVLVGDRVYDVRGAHAVGLPCIGVEFGYAEPGELEAAGADRIVPDLQGLMQILLGKPHWSVTNEHMCLRENKK